MRERERSFTTQTNIWSRETNQKVAEMPVENCNILAENIGCPKSSFLHFISLYFRTMGLCKQIISTNVVSFISNSLFSYLLCYLLTRIIDLCTSAPKVRVRQYIFQRHLLYFQSPNYSNSFLNFFVNTTKDKPP